MNYNYHTHTIRCGHATGEVEEYIKRAISCGIKFMGFSDHIPYVCSNNTESNFRVPYNEGKAYVQEISYLREKYKNEIEIKIGFEMEYYCDFFDKMLSDAIDFGAEYLILGHHFLEEEQPHPMSKYVIKETDNAEKLKAYSDAVIAAIKTGVFTYVAHPDVFNFVGDDDTYNSEFQRICMASMEYNIPLELNFYGIRDNRHYPNEKFWELAGKIKAPVTFGFDSHDILSAFDGESLIKAKKLVEKFDLNYIGKPEIIEIRKTEG